MGAMLLAPSATASTGRRRATSEPQPKPLILGLVGLDVDHQLGYRLGCTAALVMVLPGSRAGKLDGDVVTGHPGVGTSVRKYAALASIIAMPCFGRV